MSSLIALVLLLSPTYLIRFSIFGIPTTLLEVIIYLVFIIGLFQAKKVGFRKIPIWFWLPISLLVIVLIFSTLISPEKRAALGEFKGFFVDQMLVVWLIWQFIKKEDVPKLLWAFILSGVFVASYTIAEKIFGSSTQDGRVIGVFGYSPNYVSLFLAPITVILAGQFFQKFPQKKLPAYLGLSVLGLIFLLALYFAGSRGGFLAFPAGLGVFLVARYWPAIRSRVSAIIMILVIVLIGLYTSWSLLKPNLNVSPDAGRVATSNNVRWQIWQTSWQMIKDKPLLGVGLGHYQAAFKEFTLGQANFAEYIAPLALTPHNIFLMFWLSAGLLGLVAFIFLLVVFYRLGFKKITNKFSPTVLAFVSAMIIYGVVESSIWKNDLSLMFWSFWALIWII